MRKWKVDRLHNFVTFQVFNLNRNGPITLGLSKLFCGRMTLTIP